VCGGGCSLEGLVRAFHGLQGYAYSPKINIFAWRLPLGIVQLNLCKGPGKDKLFIVMVLSDKQRVYLSPGYAVLNEPFLFLPAQLCLFHYLDQMRPASK
jgi:hypothetical protein